MPEPRSGREAEASLRVRWLGWASFEVSHGDEFIVIDLFLDNAPLEPFTGELREPLLAPGRKGEASAALVTHLHADHADPGAIAAAIAPGAPVLRPAPPRLDGGPLDGAALLAAEHGFAAHRLATDELEPWQSREIGPFTITALPAVDGFGDPQLSWAIEVGGRRVVHTGDTIFHGSWWLFPMRLGPVDLALLPVNGAVVNLPHRQPPSPLPAAMDPEQAAAAAHLMAARRAMPTHYGAIHSPPAYAETADPASRFEAAARKLGVEPVVVSAGGEVSV